MVVNLKLASCAVCGKDGMHIEHLYFTLTVSRDFCDCVTCSLMDTVIVHMQKLLY
jgi:hypothetical protein